MKSSKPGRGRARVLVLGLLVALMVPMLSGCDFSSLAKTLGGLLTGLGGKASAPKAGAPGGTKAGTPANPQPGGAAPGGIQGGAVRPGG